MGSCQEGRKVSFLVDGEMGGIIHRSGQVEASADAGINPFGVLGLRWRQVSQRRRPLLVLVEKKRHMTEAVMRRCGWGQLENLAVRDCAGCPLRVGVNRRLNHVRVTSGTPNLSEK